MPTYLFESPSGRQVERAFSVAECPAFIVLHRARYRKVIAPVAILTRASGFKDSPADAEALDEQREENAWARAKGYSVSRRGSKNHATMATDPALAEIADKKDRLARGEPLPAKFDYLNEPVMGA